MGIAMKHNVGTLNHFTVIVTAIGLGQGVSNLVLRIFNIKA